MEVNVPDRTGDWNVEIDDYLVLIDGFLALFVLQKEKPNNLKPKATGRGRPRPLFADSVAESFIMPSSKSRLISESKKAMSKSKYRRRWKSNLYIGILKAFTTG